MRIWKSISNLDLMSLWALMGVEKLRYYGEFVRYYEVLLKMQMKKNLTRVPYMSRVLHD